MNLKIRRVIILYNYRMAEQKYHHEITPSWTALFRILAVVLALVMIWELHGVIIIVVLSAMLSASLYPLVRFLNRWFPLTISSIITLLLLIVPVIASIVVIIPNFIDQFPGLLKTLNLIVVRSAFLPESIRQIDFTQYTQSGINYLVNSSSRITGTLTTIIAIIFMTLYALIDSRRLGRIILSFIPPDRRNDFLTLIRELYVINGHYIRGNLLISLICGTIITTGLLAFNVPYAIPLGILAGILDLLPLIGAATGAVPALIIGFALSPTTGFLVLILFVLYQQFENNILAPSIYNRVLDLSPSLSFLSVIIGATLFGITGAFVALPLAASLPTIIRFIYRERIIQKNSKNHSLTS